MIEFNRDVFEDMHNWLNDYDKNKVLFIKGARQIGKTHVISRFVEENFERTIRINLMTSDKEDLNRIGQQITEERISGKIDRNKVNSNHELFRRFDNTFEDSEDMAIVIDEIQEDYTMFNRIREFAREFKARFIVTGSYLGITVMRKEFKFSAGDTTTIHMEPMSFEEFLKACGKYELYTKLDFYGGSNKDDYDAINDLFKVYQRIGGYPKSIERYLETHEINDSYYSELLGVILEESQNYFSDKAIGSTLVDYNILEDCILGAASLLLRDKKGADKGNYVETLSKLMNKDGTIKITAQQCNVSIGWLARANILSDCGKIVDFDFNNILRNQRFYFNDVGLSNYLFSKIIESKNEKPEIAGLIYETYIFNILKKYCRPKFGIYNQNELDFIYFDKVNDKQYAIEVKAGKNSGKSITDALSKGKIDKALYCKGNTYGGIDDKVITIPIYLFQRFKDEIMN